MKNNRPSVRLPRPDTVTPKEISILHPERHLTSCGVPIYALRTSDYEVVRVSFVFHAGSSWQTKSFCASATVNNLAEGSPNATSQQIAERLDYLGSYFDVATDRDWSVVTFVSISRLFDETMGIAREILLHPAFPEQELEIYCEKSRHSLNVSRAKADFNARELFAKTIYGPTHPYGTSSPADAYGELTRNDIVDFYNRFYTAANCFVVMSGDVTGERIRTVEQFLSEMNPGVAVPERQFPVAESQRSAHKTQPGAVQSAIRIGRRLFSRRHPDFIGMQMVATVLGGYFGSRLVHNLREEHGYTYGAFSAMVNMDESGYIAIATEVGAEFTDAAVEQIFIEIERLRREPVSGEELSLVRNMMIGEVMRILDGPFGIADVTIENIQNGFGNDYIENFIEQVNTISPERIMALAAEYLDPSALSTVTVTP